MTKQTADNPTTPIDDPAATRLDVAASARVRDALATAGGPLSEFAIVRLIGEGGMGVVYEAEQQRPKRRVALKVVRPGLMTSSMQRRFEYEADVLARLDHPGIARIYQAGTVDLGQGPQPYFAMEFVQGVRLDKYVATRSPPTRLRLELLVAICHAVHHAHTKGVIHRDLKPANILVGDDGRPKVLDFGIARTTDSDVQSVTMHTESGQLVGTLPYMAPEQAAGKVNDLDTNSDVYALGVIAYELLSGGKMPYELTGRALHEAVRVICEDEPSRLSSIDKSLRGDVETIVQKALEKEKARRYATAGEFGADVKRFLDYEPIAARPPSTWYSVRKFASRNKALVSGVAAVFVVLAAGIAVSVNYAIRERRQRAEAVRQKDLAQARFNDVRELASKFLFAVHDKVAPLAGSTPARALLVKTALEYLNRLSEQAGDDRALLRDIGLSYLRVGDVQGNPDYSNLGDTRGALDSYRKLLAISQQLADLSPNDARAQADLAISHGRIGGMLAASGDTRGALENYRKYLAISQKLADAEPGRVRASRDLLVACEKVGDMLAATGDVRGALESYRRSLEVSQRHVDADPSSKAAQRDLSFALLKVGDMLTYSGDSRGALESYRRLLEIRQKLADADLTNAIAQRDLSVAHDKVGEILAGSGDIRAALESHRKGLAISQRIADADPTNAQARRDLALGHSKVGDVLATSGQTSAALKSHRLSLEISQKLSAADPTNVAELKSLATSHEKVGDMLANCGDLEGALQDFRASLAISRKLADADVADSDAQRALGIGYFKIGNILAAMGDTKAALESCRTFLAITRKLAEADPNSVVAQREVAVALERVGTMLEAAGDREGAMRAQREALAISLKLAEADPSNTSMQRDASVSYSKIGDLLSAAGDHREALENFRKAMAIFEKLAKADPNSALAQRDVSVLLELVGSELAETGETAGALEHYRRMLEIRQKLADADPTNASAQRDLSLAYEAMGSILLLMGGDASLTTDQRIAHCREARGWYVRLVEQFELMRVRKILRQTDERFRDEAATLPGRCDEAIAELMAAAATQPTQPTSAPTPEP